MSDLRIVVGTFSARHWSRDPYEYEEFHPGDKVIPLRYESGHSIFARDFDPVSRYIMEIDSFRMYTHSVHAESARSGGASS
jgi:hypothetical protein